MEIKVGDIITRSDMPTMISKITGESSEWDAWEVESVGSMRGRLKKGLVFKNDERWVKVGGKE